jgi:hydroxyacylglutathione hydrolase
MDMSSLSVKPRVRGEGTSDPMGATDVDPSSKNQEVRGLMCTWPPTTLPGEEPKRIWSHGGLFVDLLPSVDLGNSSFVVGDSRRRVAAVVDATRDTGRYLEQVEGSGLTLKWVLDTHLHADFVSGGRELAELSGATFGISAESETSLSHQPLHDKEELMFGSGKITVLKSPGHTPEHISFLLQDEDARSSVLFSGGSLMAGTAGRPDLIGPQFTYRLVQEEFKTLHERYTDLPSNTVVLPTHVGGSFCGVGVRPTARTSMGIERRTNPLLLAQDKGMFLAAYLSSTPFPRYYKTTRRINQRGMHPVGKEIPVLPALSPEEVEKIDNRLGTTILDIRESSKFEEGHLPKSLSVPIDGAFSAWVGWLRTANDDFVIVDDDPSTRREAQIDLVRIGFDHLKGYLQGGVDAFAKDGHVLHSTIRTTMRSLRRSVENGEALTILDVRNPNESVIDRIPGAVNIPLPELAEVALAKLDRSIPIYVHCQTGRRAGIAASILEQLEFPKIVHVTDGPEEWTRTSPVRSKKAKAGQR